ncbi:MAG TPA: SpoIID/LytB domain-containing protein, partial [Solirubrobacteraceae bacterium]
MRRLRTPALLAAGALLLAAGPTADAGAATRLVIRGAGYGHGIGMSQYGAYGYALHGSGYRAILRHYYTGTALGVLDANPEVRVLLQGGRRTVRVSGASQVGDRLLDPARTYTAKTGREGIVLRDERGQKRFTSSSPMRLQAPSGGTLRVAGVSVPGIRDGLYRGAIELRAAGGALNVVNALDLENYVRGVVSGESPSTWPAEALKAQAVAARTYAITTSKAGAEFDQHADTRSQVYKGALAEFPATDAAVAATRGQVVTYGGRPATTYFFSTSGGHTENVENSFVGAEPEPWLTGVDDPYDDVSPRHRWGPLRFSGAQVEARLGRYAAGRFKRIKVLRRGSSPRVVQALVVGTRGTVPVSGQQLRRIFGLNDAWAYFTTIATKAERARRHRPDQPGGLPGDPSSGGSSFDGVRAAAVRDTTVQITGAIAPARRGAWARLQRRTAGR